jgi:hypothetical protein
MAENDRAIDRYWSFHPKLFSVLDRLELSQKSTGESPAYVLSLEIWFRPSEKDDDPRQLHLSFENVIDLKFNPSDFIEISLLEILSIREYQWEKLRYRVVDTEGNQLSFYCKQFEVEIVNKEDANDNV